MLEELFNRILEGYIMTKEEALSLGSYNVEMLSTYANKLREHFCHNTFDMCSIINAKSGACSEDCKYCAQSAHHKTCVETYDLLDKKVILKQAKENEEEGVLRFSLVTSGKKLYPREVKEIAKYYAYLRNNTSIKLCASHGLLSYEELKILKEAGVTRYHNNLETARRFFRSICTTHTYEEKIETIKAAQRAGLGVCSGGIFGLGETLEDRIDMAFELRELGITSIPLNILSPIKGTPLEDNRPLGEDEILKTIAIYRFIHPKAVLRLAGGRSALELAGKKAFLGGANAAISGNLLTTCGNTIKEDHKLFRTCGFEVKCNG